MSTHAPHIDFSVLSVMGPAHADSTCCWCKAPLRPICPMQDAQGRTKWRFWRCPQTACFQRQLQYWVLSDTDILFIPTPSQSLLFIAVVPLDSDGNVLPRAYRNVLLVGSRGSSKSHALRWLGHWLALRFPNFRVLMLRRTLPELEDSHLAEIAHEQESLNAKLTSKYELNYPTGSLMKFGHAAEEGDQRKYLSTGWDIVLIDEMVTFAQEQITDIQTSARPSPRTPIGWQPLVVGGTNTVGISARFLHSVFVAKQVSPDLMAEYNPEEYLCIESDLTDNPFYETTEYDRNLKKLSPKKYRAWRFCKWFGEDQFFGWRDKDERDDATGIMLKAHVMGLEEELLTQHTDRNVDVIERFCCMQYGHQQPGVVYWIACLKDGTMFAEDEFKFSNTLISKVAREIIRRNEKRRLTVRYVVCPDTMWNKPSQTGESLVETFRKSGLNAVKAHSDPVMGWNRVRALLDVNEHNVPWLRFSQVSCPYACLTLPALVGDKNKPEDILRRPKQDDYAADAIRHGAMSRPYPTTVSSEWERTRLNANQAGAWYDHEATIPGYTAGGSMRRSSR